MITYFTAWIVPDSGMALKVSALPPVSLDGLGKETQDRHNGRQPNKTLCTSMNTSIDHAICLNKTALARASP